ncbi:MAG: hypothetical protein ACM31D_19990 [Bacteroidota bacterium]
MSTLIIVLATILTLAACAGWGRVAARWVGIPVDGGLALSWGLAVLLALGGGAVALGIAKAPVLLGIEACGAACLFLPPRLALPRLDRAQALFLAVAAVVLMVRAVFATRYGALEPCDDLLAYQPLVQQLLQTGDMEAPFSLRRMAAYGGQTLLQAMTVPNGDAAAMVVAEAAFAPVLVLGLGWSFLRRYGSPQVLPLAFALMVGLGLVLRNNTASQATSLVCFLAVVRTLYLLLDADRRGRLCVMLGLLAAAASSLRHLNMPFPLLLMLAFLPGHVARRGWRAALVDGGMVAASWTVFLAPWMVALYASSATPLYPVFKGNHNPSFEFAAAVGGWRQVADTLLFSLNAPLFLVPLGLVPVSFFIPKDRRLCLVQGAALVGAAIIVVGFSAAEADAMVRYLQPTLLTAFFVSILAALATGVIASPLVRAAMAVAIIYGCGHTLSVEYARVTAPRPSFKYSVTLLAERLAAYAQAQESVPAGQSIYAYVSAPYGFDSARNRVFNADGPGPVSPNRAQPFFKGADALADYLQSLGIRYVAFEDFETAVTWCMRPVELAYITDPAGQAWKPFLADIRANLHQLAASRRVLYDNHGVTLVDLGGAAP